MPTHTVPTIARPTLGELPGPRRRPDPRPLPRRARVSAGAGVAAVGSLVGSSGPRVASLAAPGSVPSEAGAARAPAAGDRARLTPSCRRRAAFVRRQLVVGALTVALAGGALAVGFQVGHAGAELEGPPPAAPVYVVQPGDTLWVIAERLAPTVDPQRAVSALVRSAGGASLTPGQRIAVPASLR